MPKRFLPLLLVMIPLLFALAGAPRAQEETPVEASPDLPLFMEDGPWLRGLPAYPSLFECNGDRDRRLKVCWLSSSNPYKFRRYYTARYFFDLLPKGWDQSDYFWVQIVAKVFDQAPELGGLPSSAGVTLVVRNPDSGEEFSVRQVPVETSAEGVDLPTFVQVPRSLITDDGRVEVRIEGAGTIGLARQRLRLLFPSAGQP